jgi:alpha-ribazole phosphatase
MKYGIPTSKGAGIFYFSGMAMTQRLILVRHGDLGEGCRGRYIGRTDAPLAAEGRRQAAALAGELGRLDGAHILCSPLLRARETAEIALGADAAFTIEDDLREIDFGRWETMSFAEIAAADPAAVDRWAALEDDFTFPGGESIGAFRKRIGAAAGRITEAPVETAVAFSHGGVIRLLICHFLGLEYRRYLLFDVRPGSLSEISIEGGKGVLTRLNDRCHLGGL